MTFLDQLLHALLQTLLGAIYISYYMSNNCPKQVLFFEVQRDDQWKDAVLNKNYSLATEYQEETDQKNIGYFQNVRYAHNKTTKR